jgi:hypothetical protein
MFIILITITLENMGFQVVTKIEIHTGFRVDDMALSGRWLPYRATKLHGVKVQMTMT